MPRQRPDPAAAGARLVAVVPSVVTGGWVPPPALDDGPGRMEVTPEPPEQPAPPEQPEPAEGGQSWARPLADDDDGPDPRSLLAGLVPAGLRGGRWDPGRQGVAALTVVAIVGALLAGVVLLRGRSQPVAPPPVTNAASESAAAVLVIDVAGRVRRPGIVRLPMGSRVDDAVRAAGGALPGATFAGLNRARKLTDGEQVLVGVPAPAGSAVGSGATGDSRVDLNLADMAALDSLPGIGPVLAQKIVDWRTEHGRFASVDQLREVGGIGESKFAALKNKVRV